TSVRLIAHLRLHMVVVGSQRQRAGLVDRMGKGLLTAHVLAPGHRSHCGHRVCMIGRAHGYRVDAFFLLEHFAEVAINLCLGKALETASGTAFVDVAESGNRAPSSGHAFDIASSLSTN